MASFLCKGIADQMIDFSRQPMMTRRFSVSGERYQRLDSLYSLGWAIKAFIAMLTDTFAFLGYTRRWHMPISCIGGAAFAPNYGPPPVTESSANTAVGWILLTCFGKSNVEVLSEGRYSRFIRRDPVPGPSLMSSIRVCILTGTIIASVIQPPPSLSDSGKTQVGVFISAALQFIAGVFFVFNTYGERCNAVERWQSMQDLKKAMSEAQGGEERTRPADESISSNVADELVDDVMKKDLCQESGAVEYDEAQRGDQALRGLPDSTPSNSNNNNNNNSATTSKANATAVEVFDNEEEEEEEDDAELVIDTCCFGAFEINGVFTRNWKVVMYCVVTTCSVVTMVCVTILGTTHDLMYVCTALSVVCIVCEFLMLPLVITKANVFTCAYFTLYIEVPGVLDCFYLTSEACLPEGPHFSYTYNTVGAVIQSISGICGMTLFAYVFSKMNYQVTRSTLVCRPLSSRPSSI